MTTPEITFTKVDEPPETDDTPITGDFNPDYPGSTESAPYGFKPDGTPYLRRPKGTAKTPASPGAPLLGSSRRDKNARDAARLLARLNALIGLSLTVSGMPNTAASLADANEQFESMAYEALVSDPALCSKILSAGTAGGKAGLIMAYTMLGASIIPSARQEIAARKLERELLNADSD